MNEAQIAVSTFVYLAVSAVSFFLTYSNAWETRDVFAVSLAWPVYVLVWIPKLIFYSARAAWKGPR